MQPLANSSISAQTVAPNERRNEQHINQTKTQSLTYEFPVIGGVANALTPI